GVQAMQDLRVGYNELATIQFLRAIPEAQRIYKETDWNDNGVKSYATRLASTEGKHDGLYWPPAPDEPAAPLGPYAAQGSGRGPVSKLLGYNGYFFRILTARGPGAAGGAADWLHDGELTGGFAVIAWPAIYDESGVMSFLVGPDGVVYEQDLGEDSKAAAEAVTAYDPSQGWRPVRDS
ncbi:MAG: DUF2950 family protein, partial [Phycisphaerales bacterium]|nr:DUF2950 family protein [Phycisphaerales bacterium]